MRRNTVTFINEELFDYMQERLMCGLNGKIKTINLAKLSAYYALSFSSVLWVREPRVCVIKDFDTTIPNQKLNWINKNEDGNTVEQVYKDIKLNNTKNSIDQNINLSVHNSDKLVELLNEKEVYVSTKSACSSSESLSKAIMAVYNNEKRAESSIRISLSYKTTKKDIKKFKKIFDYCYKNKGE